MDEYITKQQAADAIKYWSPVDAIDVIRKLPAADVVEVVRCKDCKFNPLKNIVGCPMANLAYDGNRWCWRGEQDD